MSTKRNRCTLSLFQFQHFSKQSENCSLHKVLQNIKYRHSERRRDIFLIWHALNELKESERQTRC